MEKKIYRQCTITVILWSRGLRGLEFQPTRLGCRCSAVGFWPHFGILTRIKFDTLVWSSHNTSGGRIINYFILIIFLSNWQGRLSLQRGKGLEREGLKPKRSGWTCWAPFTRRATLTLATVCRQCADPQTMICQKHCGRKLFYDRKNSKMGNSIPMTV